MYKLLKKILILFIFFPYIGFVPGVDIQPFYILTSIFLILLYSHKLKISKNDLFVILLSSCLILLRVLFFNHTTISIIPIFKSFVSLLTPITIFILIKNKIIVANYKFIQISLFVVVGIGIIQLIFPDFLTFLVSRNEESIERLISSGRGVRSLFSEPSTFGKYLIVLNIILLHIGKKKKLLIKPFNFSLILLLLNLTLVGSAYSFFFHLILMLLYYSNWKSLLKITSIALFIILFLSIGFEQFFNNSMSTSRIFKIFNALLNQPEILMNEGAFKRILNIPISINNLVNYYGPLGSFGVEESHNTKLWTPIGDYEYTVSNRNLGGFIEYLLMFGIFSIPFISWVTFKLYRGLNNSSITLLAFTFFILLQDGSTSNPFSWFTLFILIYQKPEK